MTKRALLVGCNYPGTKVELHGCANDVKRMHKLLVTRYGFAESDILVLLDTNSSGVQPTGANIRSSLDKLIRGVRPGDVLVFHYSGHGTQVPSEGGVVDETGAEEAIVPTDMNLLTDDDFRALVNKIPAGATFTFISDSCHSGGLIDAEKEQIGNTPALSLHSGGSHCSLGSGSGSGSGVGDLLGLMQQGFEAFNNRGARSRDFHASTETRFDERVTEYRRDGGEVETFERHGRRRDYGDPQHGGEVEYETSYERGGRGHEHVEYSASSAMKSKEIPIGMLTQLLSERVGHRVEVGNIRTTLFDMFGKDASPTVKLFAKLALEQLEKRGHGQPGILGAVSSLATQLLAAKLEGQSSQEASHYMAAAENEQGRYRPGRSGRGDKSTDVGILLSGCQSNETSADAMPARGESYGAFSNAIQMVLGQSSAPLSNRDLILQVRKTLHSQGFKQHPCLYCSDHNSDAPFISY